jgi:hypothetical protein
MDMKLFAHRRLAVGGVLAAAAGTMALAVGVTGAAGSPARAAGTITLNDTGHLHKTSSKGFNLYESGQASGSIAGAVTLSLDVTSTTHVKAELTVHAHGGTMTGTASGNYHNLGSTATFTGTLSITRGTGTYSHAHGSGISFSGTIQRASGAVTVRVDGRLSD